jgi:hypothetical protein
LGDFYFFFKFLKLRTSHKQQTKGVVENDYKWVTWREAGERGMGSKAGECLLW